MTGIKDIDNIIFNYKYQLEHTEKLNKSLEIINDMNYRINDGNTSAIMINNQLILYRYNNDNMITLKTLIKDRMEIKKDGKCIYRKHSLICNNKYYDDYSIKNIKFCYSTNSIVRIS